MSGQVAARGVVLTALAACILGFHGLRGGHLGELQHLLGPAVAGKEGLVGVRRGFAAVELEEGRPRDRISLRVV